jgi:hypothetical protein
LTKTRVASTPSLQQVPRSDEASRARGLLVTSPFTALGLSEGVGTRWLAHLPAGSNDDGLLNRHTSQFSSSRVSKPTATSRVRGDYTPRDAEWKTMNSPPKAESGTVHRPERGGMTGRSIDVATPERVEVGAARRVCRSRARPIETRGNEDLRTMTFLLECARAGSDSSHAHRKSNSNASDGND